MKPRRPRLALVAVTSAVIVGTLAAPAFAADTVVPGVTITAPLNTASTRVNVSFTGHATDNVAVSKVEIKIDTGAWLLCSGTGNWGRNVNGFTAGRHTLYAKATDSSGNTYTRASTFYTQPSGVLMPTGNLPGWNLQMSDDFRNDTAIGGFPGVNYQDRWFPYNQDSPDTSRNGRWTSSKVLSTHNQALDYYMHTENGVHYGAAIVAKPTPSGWGRQYGRYSVRFKADPVPGYKTAWLLWPDDISQGVPAPWPDNGEIDFPEGNLDGQINAYAHHAAPATPQNPNGTQDVFENLGTFAAWHTATIEWAPGSVKFYLDDVLRGTSTTLVPTRSMHWVLQSETQSGAPPADSAAGHIYVDWVVQYSRA